MKHLRILGLALLAAFAFTALAAASASAEGGPDGGAPGFFTCVKAAKNAEKKYTGQYGEKECKTPASPAGTGKYNANPTKSGAFSSKSKTTKLKVHSTSGKALTVVCKKDKDHFVVAVENEVLAGKITYEKCEVEGVKGDDCTNSGTDNIETAALEAELVWVNEATTEAGVLLVGFPFATFKCGAEEVEVEGIVVGTVNIGGKGPTFKFAESGGKQALDSFYFGGKLGPFHLEAHGEEAVLVGEDAEKGEGEAAKAIVL